MSFELEQVPDAEKTPVGRRLATAALIVMGATAASRGFGYVREIAAAAYFGAGAEKSAFDVAFLVPSTVQVLVAQAALSAALIPVFAGLLEKGDREEAWLVVRTVFTVMALVLGLVVVLCVIFAPQIMPLFAPGYRHDPAMMANIVSMSRLLFPTVVVLAITGVVISVLNSFDHFTLPAVAPIAWNAVILLAIVLGASRLGIEAMAWGVLLGTMVQLLMQLPWLRGRGGRLGWSLAWRNRNVRRVGALMLPVSLSLGLINLNGVVDIQFASFLGKDGVAAMNYAFRLYQLPESLFAIAVGTVLFPTLSKLAARGDPDPFRATVSLGLRMIFFMLIPASAFMLVMAQPLVRLAYQHGQFGAGSTSLVSSALFFFAFGSAFSGGSAMLTRSFFSLSSPWVPTIVAIFNLGVNAFLNWLFIIPFGLGGIPLSTSVVSITTFFVLLILMRRRLGRINGREIIRSAMMVALLSAAVAAVSYSVWWGMDSWLGRSLSAQIVSLVCSMAAGAGVFIALALAARMPELGLLRNVRGGAA
ncbi:MAG: murein biosynthesis integral membrane protein MurJ [Thermoleophilia bacterium]